MSERLYVALDLETTGLEARRDAIIEIGAVSFVCDPARGEASFRIVDRFVSFVNPQRAIPLRVQQLTGIRDSDVAGAPTIAEIIPRFVDFVTPDVRAIVAHNAGFDVGFLQAAGVELQRPIQDTFELASILLPGMVSYSLGELARALAIPLPDAHRALDDAVAAAALFASLLCRIQELPVGIVRLLTQCGHESGWPLLALLGELAGPIRDDNPAQLFNWQHFANLEEIAARRSAPESLLLDHTLSPVKIPQAALHAAFAPGGPLHNLLGTTFEQRGGQLEMAERVLHALNTGDHLIIEAGTGTGKSLAYLLPAALWSTANQRRVVVATNTIALQDQLIEKDIPQATALLAALGNPPFYSAQLKGRTNYLCTRRLHVWCRNRRLSPLELRVLAKILVWLRTTTSGDVGELFLPNAGERAIWGNVCSDAATCSHGCCQERPSADVDALGARYHDFFLAARAAAEASHLLVVNHALLLADVATEGRVLPPYSHLVVDEAHRLEEAATEQLSFRMDRPILLARLRRLHADGDLAPLLRSATAAQSDFTGEQMIREIDSLAARLIGYVQSFLSHILNFACAQDSIRGDQQYAQRLSLDSRTRSQPGWSELEVEWDTCSRLFRTLLSRELAFIAHANARQWWTHEPQSAYLAELGTHHTELASCAEGIDAIMFGETDGAKSNLVAWVEVNDTCTEVTLVAAPIYVNEMIEQEFIHNKRSAIFTGATLRTGEGFAFIRDRLGLWDVTASTVDSPFDYRSNTLLFIPRDLPEPAHMHYQQAVEQAIMLAAEASGGGTLALFTSYAQLRATADAIRAPLDRAGITVLQHGAGSRQRLIREYRQSGKAVLLGTRSFWEGIDLPGDELRCLLIVRLPFAVPSDPLVAARTADLENAFRDYTLPDAILRFRQGFGRLIRRADDRGIVILLDSRVWRKEYGQAFLESLPHCTVRHAPLANLSDEIERWLLRPSGN